jgi:hypothetical protein
MPHPTTRWCEMSRRQRALAIAAITLQIGLWAAMMADLRRRPPGGVRGGRRLWFGLSFINFLGPLGYFAFGRRR